MKLLFLGPPGAGKGTQAQIAAKELKISHISTGDMLRKEIKEQTDLGKAAKDYINRGQLVPDSVIIDMVKKRLEEPDCKNGFILDGFPRTLDQAIALDAVVKLDHCINFIIDDSIIFHRICGRRVCEKCGNVSHIDRLGDKTVCEVCGGDYITRPDDNVETIKNRLEVYEKQTQPLISFYKEKGILKDIDSGADSAIVFKQMLEILK